MKQEVLQRIAAVLNALDRVSVSGRQNLTNLSGSISVLEETVRLLERCDIVVSGENTEKAG